MVRTHVETHAICVTGWGIAATCQAATKSWAGMMAARFFLGLFEAGYGPGIPYLLSFFYLRHVGLWDHIWVSGYCEREGLVPRRGLAFYCHGRRGLFLHARNA
jgi:hypothetical protein